RLKWWSSRWKSEAGLIMRPCVESAIGLHKLEEPLNIPRQGNILGRRCQRLEKRL
ncbi:hypothetical protein KI387_033282, partial [Taxus chinensis]